MMRRLVVGVLSLGFAVLVGCTAKNPDFCKADGECDDPAKPFCDVNGEFAESGHTPNICTARPAGCSIERCGCDAGQGLSCDLNQLTVCNADGHSSSVETCALGCSTEPRCLTFEPSNGLGPALEMAASEPDVVLPAGVRIDTELGTILSSSGQSILVPSAVATQAEITTGCRVQSSSVSRLSLMTQSSKAHSRSRSPRRRDHGEGHRRRVCIRRGRGTGRTRCSCRVRRRWGARDRARRPTYRLLVVVAPAPRRAEVPAGGCSGRAALPVPWFRPSCLWSAGAGEVGSLASTRRLRLEAEEEVR